VIVIDLERLPLLREEKNIVATKQESSKWKQQWLDWKENNPISNGTEIYIF